MVQPTFLPAAPVDGPVSPNTLNLLSEKSPTGADGADFAADLAAQVDAVPLPAEPLIPPAELPQPTAIDQQWALHLVPELAELPQPDAVPAISIPWPQMIATLWKNESFAEGSARVAVAIAPAAAGRGAAWQASLPSAAPAPATIAAATQTPAMALLMPRFSVAGLPPEPGSQPGLWRPDQPAMGQEPAGIAPARIDPAQPPTPIPLAGGAMPLAGGAMPVAGGAISGAVGASAVAGGDTIVATADPALKTAGPGPSAALIAPGLPAPVLAVPVLAAPLAPSVPPAAPAGRRRLPELPEAASAQPGPASLPAAAPAAQPSAAPAMPAARQPDPAPDPTPDPAADPAADLAIASDRLGEVAVRLQGRPEHLQVVMQAQPAAAALIGAEAPRLMQDLAAAGVALAGLSVNGQRTDLSGGGRRQSRQSRPQIEAIAGPARLARPAAAARTNIDRLA